MSMKAGRRGLTNVRYCYVVNGTALSVNCANIIIYLQIDSGPLEACAAQTCIVHVCRSGYSEVAARSATRHANRPTMYSIIIAYIAVLNNKPNT